MVGSLVAFSGLYWANPWGFLGLLAIPTILAIHFLQTKAKRLVITTLFLVEDLEKESTGGRHFERLRGSVPLWLQLLFALLTTLVLAAPRWLNPETSQTVVLLLDASVSMEAFRKDLPGKAKKALSQFVGTASHVEWAIFDSDRVGSPLYNGPDLEAAIASLSTWHPRLGEHDPQHAFALARARAGASGIVIYLTDRPIRVPPGIGLLSIGTPIQNRGFSGVRVNREDWEASIKNYGSDSTSLTWKAIGPAEAEMKKEEIHLGPGESITISGGFDAGQLRLEIDPDAFRLDDVLPLVKPMEKILSVRIAPDVALYSEIAKIEPNLRIESDPAKPADLTLGLYNPLAPATQKGNGIFSVREPAKQGKTQQGEIVSSGDPLVEDLAWNGLIVRDTLQAPPKTKDRVLVWQGDRPVIYLRNTEGNRQLFLNFDLDQSNARRVPAVIVLIQRFIRSVADQTPGLRVANYESNQSIPIAFHETGEALELQLQPLPAGEKTQKTLRKEDVRVLRSPPDPAFLTLSQGTETLLQGASYFADVREADFSKAESLDLTAQEAKKLTQRETEVDFLDPVWLLLAGIALIGNYAWLGRRR